MSTSIDPTTRTTLTCEIQQLCRLSRGPDAVKSRLTEWAKEFEVGNPMAFSDHRLKDALAALVVLWLANSGIRLGAWGRGYPPKREVELVDLGGAFPAYHLSAVILSYVDDLERRASLERHVMQEVASHAAVLAELTIR